MAVQAAGAPLYIGGVAVAYGFMYAVSPEFRAAHNSLGEAMVQGGSDAIDTLSDLVFGEEETQAPPVSVPQTATETGTDTGSCPALPFVHYTDLPTLPLILGARVFMPGLGGGVYLTNEHYGPVTVWMIIFIGNPLYVHKSAGFVDILADCTVPITLRQPNVVLPEYFHQGALRERPPHMVITIGAPNVFPEHPNFQGMSLP